MLDNDEIVLPEFLHRRVRKAAVFAAQLISEGADTEAAILRSLTAYSLGDAFGSVATKGLSSLAREAQRRNGNAFDFEE